jgi:hypothetical protein
MILGFYFYYLKIFFVITLKIRFTLNKILSVPSSIVSYRHNVVKHISRMHSSYTTETLK